MVTKRSRLIALTICFIFSILAFAEAASMIKGQLLDCDIDIELEADFVQRIIENESFYNVYSIDTLRALYCKSLISHNEELEAISLNKLASFYQYKILNTESVNTVVKYLMRAIEVSIKNNNHKQLLESKIILCQTYISNEIFDEAYKIGNEIYDLSSSVKDSINIAKAYRLLGETHEKQSEFSNAEVAFQKALYHCQNHPSANVVKASVYQSYSKLYNRQKQYNKALAYAAEGYEEVDEALAEGSYYKALLAYEIIINSVELGIYENEEFLDYIAKHIIAFPESLMEGHYYFLKALITESHGNPIEAIESYTKSIESYFTKGSDLEVIKTLSKTFPLLSSLPREEPRTKDIYSKITKLYRSLLQRNMSSTLLKDAFNDYDQKNTRMQYLEKSKSKYFYCILIAIALILFLLAMGFQLIRKNNLRWKNTLQQNQLNENLIENIEKLQNANSLINQKKSELQIELKEQLITISSFRNKINKLGVSLSANNAIDPVIKKEILGLLDFQSNANIIERINIRFLEINKQYISKLSNRYPKLTNNDLKLCLYLRMNLSSKEISQIEYKSVESIKVARSRLRKKLQLEPTDKLSTFLNSIMPEL